MKKYGEDLLNTCKSNSTVMQIDKKYTYLLKQMQLESYIDTSSLFTQRFSQKRKTHISYGELSFFPSGSLLKHLALF